MAFTNEELSMLKGKGYILNKDGEHFSFRVVTPAGKLNVQQQPVQLLTKTQPYYMSN